MPYREELPYDEGPDNTIAFLNEGYLYITNRRIRFNRDMFKTRLLGGKQVVCMAGKEAAEVFYDNEKFKRHGAAPSRVLNTLFGQKGVQTLDGKAHEQRKTMFMNFMSKARLQEISELVKEEWMKQLPKWEQQDSVVLYEEVKRVLSIAICRWTGVPINSQDIGILSEQFGDLFESAGKIGIKHIKGKSSRKSLESWMEELIKTIRTGESVVSETTPLYQIAMHRDLDGSLLSKHTAAVEVLNLLRPTVAISVYIVLSALALHDFPDEKDKLKASDEKNYKMFVQEVRRYYPFFPLVPAIVKKDFLWGGHDFKEGTLVLLDVYGNNHHPDLWENPSNFNSDRFKDWDKSPFDFIPQGGGDYITGHRCAGEWLTIEVMKTCLDIMVNKMDYTVPKQNLNMSVRRMPSVPKSGFIIQDVQRI
ncbi:cytochrome P450 [Pseudogracilibacillus sp. SE30717A]|uniref:cytochrome P450 n=1 Tax=Pseudogracilibacillus sp. SE30717A TaxID=3098293 RepID=UPI00300E478C